MNTSKQFAAAISTLMLSAIIGATLAPVRVSADSRRGADYFPKVTLTTQDGDAVQFYDLIKDRIVAIDLIYTMCQYSCPLETARLARAQQLLGDRMGKDIFFLSISIDPTHDTPEVLKAYAEKYQAGPGWIFLTGKMEDIDLLSKKLGLWTDPKRSQDGHEPMLLLGNEATGQWMQTNAMDNPLYTVRIIGDWLNSWKTAKPGRSYAEAAAIQKPDTGKYLFASLCSNCHTIGEGNRIGPDLATAVAVRDRDWMTQYTATPDVLREKNDPIAKTLMQTYRAIRMPNLGLSSEEASAIIKYISAEHSHRADSTPTAPNPRATGGGTVSPLLEAVLAIQQSLANDAVAEMKAQAAALRNEAAKLGTAGAAIASAAGDLEKQTGLADARTSFAHVNDAVISYMKNAQLSRNGVRIAYCPMLRKSWVQRDGPITNPYYGSKMLGCGEFTE